MQVEAEVNEGEDDFCETCFYCHLRVSVQQLRSHIRQCSEKFYNNTLYVTTLSVGRGKERLV